MWTWISGNDEIDITGEYGVQGLPSPNNMPGSRSACLVWYDNLGSTWLFGGSGYGSTSSYGNLNDLWLLNWR